jgi:hypothetical protein
VLIWAIPVTVCRLGYLVSIDISGENKRNERMAKKKNKNRKS